MTNSMNELRRSIIGGAYDNRRMIIEAFFVLNKPAKSGDIKSYLDNKLYPKKALSQRQIQRILPKLLDDRILGKKPNSDLYFILDKHQESIRYFADQFGISALLSIMDDYRPAHYTMEENLKNLVEIFGLYVVYCFLEPVKPIYQQSQDSTGFYQKNKDHEDYVPYHWVKNVFNPNQMFSFFLALLNQRDYEDIKYVFSKEKIDRISNILKKQYPLLYGRLLKDRSLTKELLFEHIAPSGRGLIPIE